MSLTHLTLHRVDSLLRFLPCDTGTVDLFPRRLASVLKTGLAVMQGVSASAADRRLQVEYDVRVQQKAVEQLYERHAKVALLLARWNSRVDRAMEQRNADLVIEYNMGAARSAVELDLLANVLQRSEALLSSPRQQLHSLVVTAAGPAQGGGPAAPALAPVAAVAAAEPAQGVGPAAPALAPAVAFAAAEAAQGGGPAAPALAPVAAVAAAEPAQGGGPAAPALALAVAHAGAASRGRELSAILLDAQQIRTNSPTSSKQTMLRYPLAALCLEPPLTIPTSLPDSWYAAKLRDGLVDKTSFEEEAAHYTKATAHLPVWVNRVPGATSGGRRMARQLYGPSDNTFNDCYFVALPWACLPELLIKSERACPRFNGELKSLPAVVWDEIVSYVCLSTVNSMFPPSPNHLRFHYNPPYGYGVIEVAESCFLVAVEWVGRLFVSPISKYFQLDGPEHKKEVEALKGDPVPQCVEFSILQPGVKWDEFPTDRSTKDVIWTCTPAELRIVSLLDDNAEPTIVRNQFIKVLTCSARGCRDEALSNQRWRDLHKVYKMYEAVCAAAPAEGPGCMPRALLRAHLLYGLFAVMVYMPFQSGKEVLHADLCGGPLLQQLAEAIAWLAWRGLLYYDVRTPNVIVSGHGASASAVLVDYDDLVIVEPHSINTFDEYIEVLKSTMGRRGEVDVSSCLLAWPALCNLVGVELRKTH